MPVVPTQYCHFQHNIATFTPQNVPIWVINCMITRLLFTMGTIYLIWRLTMRITWENVSKLSHRVPGREHTQVICTPSPQACLEWDSSSSFSCHPVQPKSLSGAKYSTKNMIQKYFLPAPHRFQTEQEQLSVKYRMSDWMSNCLKLQKNKNTYSQTQAILLGRGHTECVSLAFCFSLKVEQTQWSKANKFSHLISIFPLTILRSVFFNICMY